MPTTNCPTCGAEMLPLEEWCLVCGKNKFRSPLKLERRRGRPAVPKHLHKPAPVTVLVSGIFTTAWSDDWYLVELSCGHGLVVDRISAISSDKRTCLICTQLKHPKRGSHAD